MQVEYLEEPHIAVVSSDRPVIVDAQSALELAMAARYEANAAKLAIDKTAVTDEFFRLGSGLAGDILQKFANYHVKAAIYGDYSHCASGPLRDFMYEANHGRDFFFVSDREEAIRRLTEA